MGGKARKLGGGVGGCMGEKDTGRKPEREESRERPRTEKQRHRTSQFCSQLKKMVVHFLIQLLSSVPSTAHIYY